MTEAEVKLELLKNSVNQAVRASSAIVVDRVQGYDSLGKLKLLSIEKAFDALRLTRKLLEGSTDEIPVKRRRKRDTEDGES